MTMIPSQHSHIPVSAHTHPGMTGKNNEDRYAVSAFRLMPNRKNGQNHETPALLAVLADGIGGHRAGEVASELAVNLITQRVAASDGSQPIETMRSAIQMASQEIRQQSQRGSDQAGMGSTCACAWIIGGRLYTATVGDSRIYLARGNNIQQLSTDHTWIQEALDYGILQPNEVAGHPNAHVIRRYLGSPNPPEVDTRLRLHPQEDDEEARANQGVQLQPGDFLLLCSDGLTDLVKDEEILNILHNEPLEQAVQALIDQANQRGGHDNITVVLMHAPQGINAPPARRIAWRRWALTGCLGLALLLALAVAAMGGWLWYTNRIPQQTPTFAPGEIAPLIQPQQTSAATGAVPQATATAQPIRGSQTPALPPTQGGPTLTPWPTNTRLPNTTTPTP